MIKIKFKFWNLISCSLIEISTLEFFNYDIAMRYGEQHAQSLKEFFNLEEVDWTFADVSNKKQLN